DINGDQADAFTTSDNRLTDRSGFESADGGKILQGMDPELAKLTGFTEGEINQLAALTAEVDDAAAVGRDAQKATIYAGDEKNVDSTNTTMFVTFGTREQLKQVKSEIRKLQLGNEKTIGQVVYEKFLPV